MTDAIVSTATDARPALLEVQDVHKRFAGVHALRGIDLRIEAGQIYHLLGENGCGKSTLIKIISGAQPPSGGRLLVDGEPRRADAGAGARVASRCLPGSLAAAEHERGRERRAERAARARRRPLARWLRPQGGARTAARALAAVGCPPRLPRHPGRRAPTSPAPAAGHRARDRDTCARW
jgi:simple sugar transport system ATP-binding protein